MLRFIAIATTISCLFMTACVKKTDDAVTTTSPDVKTFTFTINMAYLTTIDASPSCFIDLDKGVTYNVQTAPAHADEIDLVWHYYGFDQCYLRIPNHNMNIATSNAFDIGTLGFGSWSVRNSGLLEYSTSLSKGQVANIKTVSDLTTFIKDDLPIQPEILFDGTSATYAKVYTFETGAKKRGVLIANSNTVDSNGGRANITVKIEP